LAALGYFAAAFLATLIFIATGFSGSACITAPGGAGTGSRCGGLGPRGRSEKCGRNKRGGNVPDHYHLPSQPREGGVTLKCAN
jgi:hypothetical protein